MRQSKKGASLTPEAAYILGEVPASSRQELLSWIDPAEAAEHLIELMRHTTLSEEWTTYTDEHQTWLWLKTNLIRAVLFDLKKDANND
jgi:hypothetical protein